MTSSLTTLYHRPKLIEPDTWWKLKSSCYRNSHYQYRKVLKIEHIQASAYVECKDCIAKTRYRLDYFLQNHTPITSRWEIFYAKLNHLTSGFFY